MVVVYTLIAIRIELFPNQGRECVNRANGGLVLLTVCCHLLNTFILFSYCFPFFLRKYSVHSAQSIVSVKAVTNILNDKRFVKDDFTPGDSVLIERMWDPNNGKLAPVKEGPFTILKKLSPVTFEVNRPVQTLGCKTDVVHVSKL